MTASILDVPNEKERVRALLDRRTDRTGDCWVWDGSTIGRGYGNFRIGGQNFLVHRSSYEIHHGPIPEGLMVLHSCDNPPCANPDHLRVGTNADNMRDRSERGRHPSTAKTHCPKGHPYDEANTYRFPDNRRACRICKNGVPKGVHPSTAKTHCPKGHPYDEVNTYRFPDGRRACRTCRKAGWQARRTTKNGSTAR
ncbi:HNH endonuclease signature motif containing protein [Streptomyces sp. NBC_01763]|uniref:HNH endonuclease signature motif containing protein n=1 Tax=Streptomyces sp. NBC_01763 TaxID=2975934 RepID=UPI002DDA4490|nr:HNH endonuclease signature motif containing protein [Streptomyces sp. NBC_01763]WSC35681.1 HNH endonuclease [Streptomyces sp. NBC_01763]